MEQTHKTVQGRDITQHPPPLPIGASRAAQHRKGRGGGHSGGPKGPVARAGGLQGGAHSGSHGGSGDSGDHGGAGSLGGHGGGSGGGQTPRRGPADRDQRGDDGGRSQGRDRRAPEQEAHSWTQATAMMFHGGRGARGGDGEPTSQGHAEDPGGQGGVEGSGDQGEKLSSGDPRRCD